MSLKPVPPNNPLREWRYATGLTQVQIANELGVAPSVYAKEERTDKPRRIYLLAVEMLELKSHA